MRRALARTAGFTLLELMVAIAVAAMVFLSVFAIIRSGINTQMFVREMSDAGRQGPAILQQISEDLENAYFYNIFENDIFVGKKVENGDFRADRLHFITTRPSLLADSNVATAEDDLIGHPAMLSEVSWLLKPSETDDRYFELHRREQPGLDDDISRGGYYRMITNRIISFKVQYTGWDLTGSSLSDSFGGIGGENGDQTPTRESASTRENGSESDSASDEDSTLTWEDDWDAVERGGLPVAVKIEMVLSPDLDPQVMERMIRNGREAEIDQHYIHIVLLPQFREDPQNMKATYAWDGTVAEPFQTGGVAGGAGRGANQGEAGEGEAGGRGGRGGRGKNNGGKNGGATPNTNTNTNTNSPFLDAIRGGGNKGGNGGLGGLLGGGKSK